MSERSSYSPSGHPQTHNAEPSRSRKKLNFVPSQTSIDTKDTYAYIITDHNNNLHNSYPTNMENNSLNLNLSLDQNIQNIHKGNKPNLDKNHTEDEYSEMSLNKEEVIPDWQDPQFYIWIDRDYSGVYTDSVTGIRFDTTLPTVLKGAATVEVFQNTIEKINSVFSDAEKLSCDACVESLLSYFTCTLINFCRKTRMENAMEQVQSVIYEENDSIYHPIGLHLAHPMARGLREIIIRNISGYGLYSEKVEEPATSEINPN